jgi:hypothetical protein
LISAPERQFNQQASAGFLFYGGGMAGTLLNNTIDKTDANQQLASTLSQGGLLMRMVVWWAC